MPLLPAPTVVLVPLTLSIGERLRERFLLVGDMCDLRFSSFFLDDVDSLPDNDVVEDLRLNVVESGAISKASLSHLLLVAFLLLRLLVVPVAELDVEPFCRSEEHELPDDVELFDSLRLRSLSLSLSRDELPLRRLSAPVMPPESLRLLLLLLLPPLRYEADVEDDLLSDLCISSGPRNDDDMVDFVELRIDGVASCICC